MKLRDFKGWLETLDEHHLDFEVVVCREGAFKNDDQGRSYRIDEPIIETYVDEVTEEVCIRIEEEEDLSFEKDILC